MLKFIVTMCEFVVYKHGGHHGDIQVNSRIKCGLCDDHQVCEFEV